jgi:predicted NAD/FAD-binding protein
MSNPRVAIVGTGVAGLSAAYALKGRAELTLLECGAYVGGHTNTARVEEEGAILGIDTAFIIFNPVSYPRFTPFLQQLGIGSTEHVSTFSFFDRGSGVEYVSDDFDLPAHQLAARYEPWLCGVIEEGKRFHRDSPKDFQNGRANVPLSEYLQANGYSTLFRDKYICHLLSALWSIPDPEVFWEIPASTVIGFFCYHGSGGLGGRMTWRTVDGGSACYVKRLLEIVKPEVRLNCKVVGVEEVGNRVELRFADGQVQAFDYVVVATHADDALRMLARPTSIQQRLLSVVHYHPTRTVLHTDPSVMPRDRERWVSWNYGRVPVNGDDKGYVVYYMNRIQNLKAKRQYFITLDYPLDIDPASIVQEYVYTHPGITMPVREMQRQVYSLNNEGRVKFCGSYFHSRDIGPDLIGSHEAAFSSGEEAAKSVLSMMDAPMQHWVL